MSNGRTEFSITPRNCLLAVAGWIVRQWAEQVNQPGWQMQTEDLKGHTSELSLTDLFLSLDSEEKDSQFPVTEQAAQMIGVSQRTIEHWCEIGKLDFIRVGNRIRVWHESLKNMISTE